MGVSQIGRQDGQSAFRIVSVAIPPKQSLDRKAVPEIVQAWATARIHSAQSDLPGQAVEGPMDLALVQPVAVLIDEERSVRPSAKAAVPAPGVIAQNLTLWKREAVPAGTSQTLLRES